MRVSVNIIKNHINSTTLCQAFAKGIKVGGDTPQLRTDHSSDMKGYDAALFWGFTTECQRLAENCKAAGIPWVFMDLGYFGREKYFKVMVNDRHPTSYIMNRNLPNDRWQRFGIPIQPWATGRRNILIAGMSHKAAWSYGVGFEAWEREVVDKLRTLTDRTIIYRPKPNSLHVAKPIPGAVFDKTTPLSALLASAYCVIAHNSNTCCEALLAGVPVFTRYGAARPLGLGEEELHRLENPLRPEGREQWAANLAYSQWTTREMASGECWRHIKSVIRDLADKG